MKSMTFAELDQSIERAQKNLGCLVDDFIYFEEKLVLLFSKESSPYRYFVMDVSKKGPAFFVGNHPLPRFKKEKKPISLFLQSRLKGVEFTSVVRQKELGRVVHLDFEGLSLELHLATSIKNIIAREKGTKKQITLFKPKSMEPVKDQLSQSEPRDVEGLLEHWIESFQAKSKSVDGSDPKRKRDSLLKKLNQTLEEMKKDSWGRLAQFLSVNVPSETLPEEWSNFYDKEMSWELNREEAFRQSKKQARKREGLEKRIAELRDPSKVPQKEERPLQLQDVKLRKRQFQSHGAHLGKTGKDNLKLLRAAKPWHYWIHIKDLPGAHCILTRNKSQKVSHDLLGEVARWMLDLSLKTQQKKDWKGGAYEFLCSECRYVTPIKGDRLGRVQHRNSFVFSVRY